MRRLLFIMIALSINLRTEAQKINSKIKNKRHTDTVQFFVGKKQITIIENTGNRWGIRKNNVKISKTSKFCGHWAGIDVGINGFAGEDYSVYNGYKFMDLYKLKSIGINLNILQYDIGLQQNRNTIGMVTGLGLESNNYRFDKKITIEKGETGIIQPELLYSDWEVKKSKLTTLYLTLPLFLEFQIPVKYSSRRIHFSAGVVGGLRIESYSKVKYRENNKISKNKEHHNFNLKILRYSAQVRLGYKNIRVFANYGLTGLFEDNKGPKLTPYAIGFTLVRFKKNN